MVNRSSTLAGWTSWLFALCLLAACSDEAEQSASAPVGVQAAETLLGIARRDLGNLAAAGDFVKLEVADGLQYRRHIQTFVRRQPFAFRREVRIEGSDAVLIEVSDGRHGWQLDKAGRSQLLRGEPARLLLEAAWVEGLQFLVVPALDQRAQVGKPQPLGVLPSVPPLAAVAADVIPLSTHLASGLTLRLYLDAATGRLHGLANPAIQPQRNVRYGEFREFGPLQLPGVRVENRGNKLAERTEVRSIHFAALDPSLFPASPVPSTSGWIDASPLEVRFVGLPGACYVLLPDCRVDGRPAGAALLDSGAGRTMLDEHLANSLGLAAIAPRSSQGLAGRSSGTRRWVEECRLPGFSMAQIEVSTAAFPETAASAAGSMPRLALANEVLGWSPVLDFGSQRFWLRAGRVEPLAGRGVFHLPLSRQRYEDLDVVPVQVGGKRLDVILDTGMHVTLRLTKLGLTRAGLPADPSLWRQRGAVPTEVVGAGGHTKEVLLAWLDAFELGPVRFESPLVMLDFTAPLDEQDEGSIGAAALVVFRRVGLDRERRRLELEPGPALVQRGDGWGAVPPGSFFGMCLQEADAVAVGRGENTPVVFALLPNSPWASAGVAAGDRVIAIDGAACTETSPLWYTARSAAALVTAKQVTVDLRKADGRVLRLLVVPK